MLHQQQQQQQGASSPPPPPGFAAAMQVEQQEGGGGGGGGEESERTSGGNRWPKQETIALLKIRSEMDVEFKDSSLKGPLWQQVSRKLAELGYYRSAKKCKEKFENVYKYNKRTKDGRTTKPDGKTYRFFDELQALDTHSPSQPSRVVATTSMLPNTATHAIPTSTVSSTPSPINSSLNVSTNPVPSIRVGDVPSFNMISLSNSTSSASSTSSDEQHGERKRKRKRKWKDFFESLMGEVIKKQEELEKKFLDALEKSERDRMIREEAWRVQEMTRINKEHELLVQERSMVAAKDAAVIEFLQKISDQQKDSSSNPITIRQLQQLQLQLQPVVQPPAPQPPPPLTQPLVITQLPPSTPAVAAPQPQSNRGATDNLQSPTPSRWPKAEIEALIHLRRNLDNKYNETSPKGPLWEDISAGMQRMGYNRNAKRCKEKWENINKYYKKVKESNKKRPEDAKTCPYFHQLDALYKEKSKLSHGSVSTPMLLRIVQPEQQWPLQQHQQQQDTEMEDPESENNDNFNEGDEEDGEDDDDSGAGYEVVTNKQPASSQAF
ncbi:trihelix transcription factor DF1-like [Apium graveolens]|uniref:trihelix transcription factor DF1-like n=1 Tax=Apium graveolens TaxID=4045 RepID=UPI003D7A51A3